LTDKVKVWGVVNFLVDSEAESLEATAELADELRFGNVRDEKAMAPWRFRRGRR
jgi:hypothetical protein